MDAVLTMAQTLSGVTATQPVTVTQCVTVTPYPNHMLGNAGSSSKLDRTAQC